MIIDFRVINHRSIRDELTLSLVASPRHERALRTKDLRVPELVPIVAILGPNASGKSTVLDAVAEMRRRVLLGATLGPDDRIPRQPFLLDGESFLRSTEFEMSFFVGAERYQYGFEFTDHEVVGEWLYVTSPGGRRRMLFVRDQEGIEFSRTVSGRKAVLAETTRPNQLLLSKAALDNHHQLTRVYQFFSRKIQSADLGDEEDRHAFTISALRDHKMRNRVLDLLNAADLGIEEIHIEQDDLPATPSVNPGEFDIDLGRAVDPRNLSRMVLELRADSTASLTRLEFGHCGSDGCARLPYSAESRGTQAFFAFLGPILFVLDAGAALFVDEIDSSLHPALTVALIRLFEDPESNPNNAQLIFTGHDTTPLSRDVDGRPITQRDQVWLADKTSAGVTMLTPLSDFVPRRDENLERSYRLGRFDSIPRLPTKLPVGRM